MWSVGECATSQLLSASTLSRAPPLPQTSARGPLPSPQPSRPQQERRKTARPYSRIEESGRAEAEGETPSLPRGDIVRSEWSQPAVLEPERSSSSVAVAPRPSPGTLPDPHQRNSSSGTTPTAVSTKSERHCECQAKYQAIPLCRQQPVSQGWCTSLSCRVQTLGACSARSAHATGFHGNSKTPPYLKCLSACVSC